MKVYYIVEVTTESVSRYASEPYTSYFQAALALEARITANPNYSGSVTSRII